MEDWQQRPARSCEDCDLGEQLSAEHHNLGSRLHYAATVTCDLCRERAVGETRIQRVPFGIAGGDWHSHFCARCLAEVEAANAPACAAPVAATTAADRRPACRPA